MWSTSPFGLSHIQIEMYRHGRVGRKDYDLATQNTEQKSLVIFHISDLELKTITSSFRPVAFNSSFLLSISGLPPRSRLIIISCLLCNINAPYTSAKVGSDWDQTSLCVCTLLVHEESCLAIQAGWYYLGFSCLTSEIIHAPDQYNHERPGKGSDCEFSLHQEKSPMIPQLFNTINSHETGLNLPSVCYLYHHQCQHLLQHNHLFVAVQPQRRNCQISQ